MPTSDGRLFKYEQVPDLLAKGLRDQEIAKIVRSTSGYVSIIRKASGFPVLPKLFPVRKNRERVLAKAAAMRLAGDTLETIAGKLGLSRQRVHQMLNPTKSRARWLVAQALKQGEIKKPKRCSECGKDRELASHHDDYAKPLSVLWLCRDCHIEADRINPNRFNGFFKRKHWDCHRHTEYVEPQPQHDDKAA